jgi:hypothetical protein
VQQFIDFVQSYVPAGWKTNSTGWTSGNCPMCRFTQNRPDTKKRGGFKFEGGGVRYHCFNCGYVAGWNPDESISPKLRKLLEVLGADTADIQRYSLVIMGNRELGLYPAVSTERKRLNIDWKETALPVNSKQIFNDSSIDTEKLIVILEYLESRNLSHWPDWYYSSFRMYSNRIILPLRYKDKIVGYTARYLGTPAEGNPKYIVKHPEGFVFNLDRQRDNRKYVIVTEGYLDAISVDGVGIGTNTISQMQADIIESLGKKIIVLPDRNKPGMKLVEAAIDRNWWVSFPPWEGDVIDAAGSSAEYGRLFTVKTAIEFAIDNATKAEVMMKTWCK